MANRTPMSGDFNLTFVLTSDFLDWCPSQYRWYASDCDDGITLQNDEVVSFYYNTGPFNVTIIASFFGDGWVRITAGGNLVSLVDNGNSVRYWIYLDQTL